MNKLSFTVFNKKYLVILCLLFAAVLIHGSTAAIGDSNRRAPVGGTFAMPVLVPGEYGTNTDNENNAGTGVSDGDMDSYIYNTSSNHPIEFNINVPVANAPDRSGTLRMDVYDVDTSSGEEDEVFVNGTKVGVLNGTSDTWGVNIFNIPMGVLKNGKNRVKIMVDKNNSGMWAVTIDWGIIKLASATGVQISKGWFTPISVTRGNFMNAFAEISDPSNKAKNVAVYNGSTWLFKLTDPDNDNIWSGQFKVPAGWPVAWNGNLRILAKNGTGGIIARWPGVQVK